jgi:hypothetical protein
MDPVLKVTVVVPDSCFGLASFLVFRRFFCECSTKMGVGNGLFFDYVGNVVVCFVDINFKFFLLVSEFCNIVYGVLFFQDSFLDLVFSGFNKVCWWDSSQDEIKVVSFC